MRLSIGKLLEDNRKQNTRRPATIQTWIRNRAVRDKPQFVSEMDRFWWAARLKSVLWGESSHACFDSIQDLLHKSMKKLKDYHKHSEDALRELVLKRRDRICWKLGRLWHREKRPCDVWYRHSASSYQTHMFKNSANLNILVWHLHTKLHRRRNWGPTFCVIRFYVIYKGIVMGRLHLFSISVFTVSLLADVNISLN